MKKLWNMHLYRQIQNIYGLEVKKKIDLFLDEKILAAGCSRAGNFILTNCSR